MKVSVICVADRPMRLPLLVWSLIAQTHTDWELLVLDQSDDGLVTRHCPSDPRIRYFRVPRRGDWGQTEKEEAGMFLADGDVFMFPADDAYYAPPALETFVDEVDAGAELAICGWVYDLPGYVAMAPEPTVGRVDVGAFAVRADTFRRHGWPSKAQTGDGELVRGLVDSGVSVSLCPNILYVKN